ncbi:NAD(P)-dependent oxidoreductase [Streptomyces sp. NPDC059193]|uniref:NAD(P)-dependent oxidoreductase n=1 Tax=Streptomyces sp. NPDC059193 TaxID=3346763 RepID=UPI00368D633B
MATVAIVAATGRTGRILVEQALTAGHTVTAIARKPQSLDVNQPRLTARDADVLTPGSLDGLLHGHDVVISALGSPGRGPTTVYSAGTATIAAAMEQVGMRRLIVLSSAGLGVPDGAPVAMRLFAGLLRRIMRGPYTDMARMEHFLATSDLDWTSVRPTALTDKPGSTTRRVSLGATAPVGNQTSRTDLARYIIEHLEDPATYRTTVAISS